jgi:hypothetical protein
VRLLSDGNLWSKVHQDDVARTQLHVDVNKVIAGLDSGLVYLLLEILEQQVLREQPLQLAQVVDISLTAIIRIMVAIALLLLAGQDLKRLPLSFLDPGASLGSLRAASRYCHGAQQL